MEVAIYVLEIEKGWFVFSKSFRKEVGNAKKDLKKSIVLFN